MKGVFSSFIKCFLFPSHIGAHQHQGVHTKAAIRSFSQGEPNCLPQGPGEPQGSPQAVQGDQAPLYKNNISREMAGAV